MLEKTQPAWTPEQLMQVRDVSQARVSPDGKRAAYCVTEPVMTEEKSEYITQIYLADAAGDDIRQITFGEKSSSDPQWSPDGKWLAFLRQTGKGARESNPEGKKNLFLLRADGGEAEPLTDLKADVAGFAWSPDSSRLAFVMPDPKTEAEEKREKGKDDWRWHEEEIKYNRLYVIALAKDEEGKREPRRLTEQDYNVSGPFGGADITWSPDGKQIAFTHTRAPFADDWTSADVSIVEVESGATRPLAATAAAEAQPRWSPDGARIALVISDDPPRWAFHGQIAVIPAEGGTPRRLPETYDGMPSLLGWSADGKRLYFQEARGVHTQLYALEVETGESVALNPGEGVLLDASLSPSRAHFGFTMQTWNQPKEAFVTPAEAFAPTPVSRVNANLPERPLGKTEVIRWQSTEGLEIEGLLTYPVNYETGQRAPLLLVVHGGPAGVYQENFIAQPSLYPVAAFAARGYAVLRANPRGSSGYGAGFRCANRKDWGGGDYRDLMAGVDHVIALGVADPEQLGVMGWSYGGFMTSWIITQTHRFKAASVGAAVTNLMSFNGTADIPSFVPDYFDAQFWDDLDLYRAHSAMFQVKGVTTPALIQHGECDARVPISQGYEFYNALKQQGVPVRMLVLPRQPHGPIEPKMMLKVMETNLEWFDKYLGAS
jgi:dipeptidyl aminopeptidase/acylaminoacyl peptidase